MRTSWTRTETALVLTAAGAGAVAGGYLGLITAAVPVDVNIGRRHIRLGPRSVDIHAARDTVFDLLAEPYLGRRTRAMAEKIHILARGSDMVLAVHRTPVHGGRLVATTVETVRFTRPERVEFGLVRGPSPRSVNSSCSQNSHTPRPARSPAWNTTANSAPTCGPSAPPGASGRRPLGTGGRGHLHRGQDRSRTPCPPLAHIRARGPMPRMGAPRRRRAR